MSRADRTTASATDRWLNAVVYYGLGQQLLLALPFLWLVFQQPTGLALAEATLVAMPGVALAIAPFRLGVVPDSRDWPTLSRARLGTGTADGYRAFVRRAATLSAILSFAVTGGALTLASTGSAGVMALVTCALTAVGVALVPSFETNTLPMGAARVGFHAAGLVVLAWFARPFDLAVGVTSAPLTFLAVVGCVAVDARPVARAVGALARPRRG